MAWNNFLMSALAGKGCQEKSSAMVVNKSLRFDVSFFEN